MINVSRLMNDPCFSSHYTVKRRKGKWVNGRVVMDEPEILKFYGPVQPATQKEIDQMPEGDRHSGTMKFFCKPPKRLYITREKSGEVGTSDEIIYRGELYKIFAVKDWTPNGYIRAFAYVLGSVDDGATDSEINNGH